MKKDELKVVEDESFVRITFSIKPSVLARLDKMANELKITRSGFIQHLVLFADADSPRDIAPLLKSLLASLTSEFKGAIASKMKKA